MRLYKNLTGHIINLIKLSELTIICDVRTLIDKKIKKMLKTGGMGI